MFGWSRKIGDYDLRPGRTRYIVTLNFWLRIYWKKDYEEKWIQRVGRLGTLRKGMGNGDTENKADNEKMGQDQNISRGGQLMRDFWCQRG